MATQVGATNQTQPSISPGSNAVATLSDGRVVRLAWIPAAQVYRLLVTADGVSFTQIGADISQFFSYYWSIAVDPSDNLYLASSDGVEGAGGTSPQIRVRSFIRTQSGWSASPVREFSSGISGVGIAETRLAWVASGRAGGHLIALWYSGNWQTARVATFNCDYCLGQTGTYVGSANFLSTGGLQNTSGNYFRIAVSASGPTSNAALVLALNTSSGYLNPNLVSVDSGGAITYGNSANLSSSNWPQGTSQGLPGRTLRIGPGKWLLIHKSGQSSSEYVAGVITDLSNNPGPGVTANLNSLFGFPVSYAQTGWDAFADPQAADVGWCMAPIESVVNSKSQLRRVKLTVSGTTVTWGTSAVDDELITLPSGYVPNVFRAGQQPVGRAQWGVDYYNSNANNGSGGYYSATGSTVFNNPPAAATPTTPSAGSSVDRTQPITLAWVFNDPDAGDSQSKADLRYRLRSATDWTVVLGATTTATSYALPANQAAGDYEWQVKAYDAQGVEGPWSTSSFFTAANPPGTPVITAPANGGTVATASYTVTWSSPTQDAYEVRRVADSSGSPVPGTVYATTGVVEDSTSRSRTLAFETNNRTEHIQVRVRYSGIWSAWASARALVSYTRPPTPVAVLTPDNTLAAMNITITNPTPSGSQPAVSGNQIYVDNGDGLGSILLVDAQATNSTFVYRLAVPFYDYAENKIRVVAVGANGTSAEAYAT